MSTQPSWLRRLTAPLTRISPTSGVQTSLAHSGAISARDRTIYVENVSTPDVGETMRALKRDQRTRALRSDGSGSNPNGRVVFEDAPPLFVDPLADESIPGPVRVAMHKVRCAEIRLGDANRRAAKFDRELVKANEHLTKVRDRHSGDTASVTGDTTSSDAPRHHELLNDLIDAQNVMLAAEAAEFTAEVSYRNAQAETAAAADELRKTRRRVAGGDRR